MTSQLKALARNFLGLFDRPHFRRVVTVSELHDVPKEDGGTRFMSPAKVARSGLLLIAPVRGRTAWSSACKCRTNILGVCAWTTAFPRSCPPWMYPTGAAVTTWFGRDAFVG